MKSVLSIIMVTALALLGISCGGSGSSDSATPPTGSPAAASQPSAPAASSQPSGTPAEPSPPVAVSLAGTWSGSGVDSNSNPNIGLGKIIVTWTLTHTDAGVSGTVTTQSADPLSSGTCSSCHRTKTGTISGTIDGTTLTWTMSFPGVDSDPCPTSTATLTGTASLSEITEGLLRGLYTGNDKFEGPFLDGTLTMARQP